MSSIAPGGMETPVRRYSSAFHPKRTNSSPSWRASLTRSSTLIPCSITSGPMPSPGMTAIFLVAMARGLYERRPDQLDAARSDRFANLRIAKGFSLAIPLVVPVSVSGDLDAWVGDELGHAVDIIEKAHDCLCRQMPGFSNPDCCPRSISKSIQKSHLQPAFAPAAIVHHSHVANSVFVRQPPHY